MIQTRVSSPAGSEEKCAIHRWIPKATEIAAATADADSQRGGRADFWAAGERIAPFSDSRRAFEPSGAGRAAKIPGTPPWQSPPTSSRNKPNRVHPELAPKRDRNQVPSPGRSRSHEA